MGAFLISLNVRFRRLVVSTRRTWLCAGGAGPVGRSSCEVGSPSIDFRPPRPGSRLEFRQMAQHYHVDLARAPLDLVRDAELTCVNCQDVRRCRRCLARESIDDPLLFCANAPLFNVLAAKQANATMRGR
jgi:hypothetical protein